jgi:hypothetical protein
MGFDELDTLGWVCVEGISSTDALLDLGRFLGCPVPSPNGEMVKEIRLAKADKAAPGSQSAIYGSGPFPLHTDTVFWPTPIRYVILRGFGDTRRPTTLMSLGDVLGKCGPRATELAEQSIWTVGGAVRSFYCSLRFRHGDSAGWRYDADLMSPANPAAVEIRRRFHPIVTGPVSTSIEWSGDTAVVLANWKVLHGRGPEPPNEGVRVIERLYVR